MEAVDGEVAHTKLCRVSVEISDRYRYSRSEKSLVVSVDGNIIDLENRHLSSCPGTNDTCDVKRFKSSASSIV